jgi:GNAT superfamily N-acetyltransferase
MENYISKIRNLSMPINPSEKKLKISNTVSILDKPNLLSNLVDCEAETWEKKDWRASDENIKSRYTTYPEGFIISEDLKNNKIAGFSSAMVLNYDPKLDSWFKVTNDGTITNHDINGTHYYIVSVSSKYQGQGVGSKLILEHVKNANQIGKKLCICPRIAFEDLDSISKESVEKHIRIDPKMRFYTKLGFKPVNIYTESDEHIQGKQVGVFMVKN